MMPCYNNSRFILEAIQSVLIQTFEDLELIVVDDASTDGSVALIESCQDSRIRLIKNRTNRGIAAVRNQLLDLACGRYLTSLDGDDLYRSQDKLTNELMLMSHPRQTATPLIVYSDIELIDALGNVISQASLNDCPREGLLFQGLLDRTIMIPRDFLMPAELAKCVGHYDESLAIYEDWDYKLRLAQRANFAYTNHVGIGYRRHGAGLSSAPKAMHEYFREKIRRKYGIHGFDQSAVGRLRMMMRPSRFFASTKAA